MSPSDESPLGGRASRRPSQPCPCCRYITLTEPGAGELCPVCFWEDDGVIELTEKSEANGITLSQARRSFARLGAKDWESRPFVLPASERHAFSRES